MLKFKVFYTFYISSLNQLIIVGDIIKGTVSKGMKVNLNYGLFDITSIEQVDGRLDGKWVSRIGLKLKIEEGNLRKKIVESIQEGTEIEIVRVA